MENIEQEVILSPVLKSLKDDFDVIGATVKEFSQLVVAQEISDFPVYVAYREETPIGKPFIQKDELLLNWNYNASTLEDFVEKKIVLKENVQNFMDAYGDSTERACVLILMEEEAGFLFVPFK